jgi:hypothetical protein
VNDMWRPLLDRPLGSDPAIQLVVNFWRRRRQVPQIILCLGAAVLMFAIHRGFSMLGVMLVLAAAVLVAGVVQAQRRVKWWLPAAQSLLDGPPPVRVRSEAVGGEKTWTQLSVDGGRLYLHLTNTEDRLRQLLARQREVSLVGPNADGVAAVIVDGLAVPLPARVVPAPASPRPIAVTDEDLPRVGAAKAARMVWISLAFVGLLGASVIFDVLLNDAGWVVATIAFVGALALFAVAALFRRGNQHRMVKLLGNGPWQAYPVQLLSWSGNPAPIGQLRLMLTLPDGTVLPVWARYGEPWLIANISATGYLWVAGTPTFGGSAVIGLPGLPFVTAAQFKQA